MISVTVEIHEDALTRRVRITAPSIKQALEIAGEGKPGHKARLLFPIGAETFFVPESPTQREAA